MPSGHRGVCPGPFPIGQGLCAGPANTSCPVVSQLEHSLPACHYVLRNWSPRPHHLLVRLIQGTPGLADHRGFPAWVRGCVSDWRTTKGRLLKMENTSSDSEMQQMSLLSQEPVPLF